MCIAVYKQSSAWSHAVNSNDILQKARWIERSILTKSPCFCFVDEFLIYGGLEAKNKQVYWERLVSSCYKNMKALFLVWIMARDINRCYVTIPQYGSC